MLQNLIRDYSQSGISVVKVQEELYLELKKHKRGRAVSAKVDYLFMVWVQFF